MVLHQCQIDLYVNEEKFGGFVVHDLCKWVIICIQVKFEVKIAAGYRPKDIVIEEAKYAKANWIVMDRSFTPYPSLSEPYIKQISLIMSLI